jgi:hypothetical protein
MAAIDFCALILSDAGNLADQVYLPTMSGLIAGLDTRGEVRTYANGYTALITRAGRPQKARARLPLLDRSQIAWIRAHSAKLVLVRSGQGHKFYAAYFSPEFEEVGVYPQAGT